MHQYQPPNSSESSALVSTLPNQKGSKSGLKKPFKPTMDDRENPNWRPSPIDKDKLKCSHCGKMRQTRENCWDLIGRSERFNKPGFMRTNSVSAYENYFNGGSGPQKMVSLDNSLTSDSSRRMVTVYEEELENLRRFKSQLESTMVTQHHPSTSSFASAHSGTNATAFHASSTSSWS